MSKDDHSTFDSDLLSEMSVAELRDICKKLELHVSGKKSVLIDRINSVNDHKNNSINDEIDELILIDDDDDVINIPENEISKKIDELILQQTPKSTVRKLIEDDEKSINLPSENDDSEVFVAEIIQSDISKKVDKIIDIEDNSPTVITLPSLKNLKLDKKVIGAIFAALLLVGGTVFFVINNDNSFSPRSLKYGDEMNFNVEEAKITILGDDMVKIFRDSSGSVLEDACGELEISMNGVGKVSVSREEKISTDNLGRSGFYTAEKKIEHTLVVDFEGKTWRDVEECGNLGWSMAGNSLDMITTSWTELEAKELKRTKTDIIFEDIENKITNMQSVTYGLDGVSELDVLLPVLTLPLKPIELKSFFGDRSLSEGSSSIGDESWNSDWEWSVGKEFKSSNHGLVRTINIYHSEIGKCIGHANIEIQVKENYPWPIRQEVDILIDKNAQNNECNFLVSSATDSLLPDGKLTIRLKMGESSSVTGTTPIDWGKDYLKPEAFDDRPRSSDKKKWIDSMWDESDLRSFNLEDAKQCLINNHPSSDISIAIIDGGYIWQASYNHPENSINSQWNLSWVDPDDKSGWLTLDGIDSEDCTIINSENNAQGEINWNKDSVPDTPTLSLLEQRILDEKRYPDLHDSIANSQNSWNSDVKMGYRLSVSEESELLSLIPIDLIDGQVSMSGTRKWTNSGKDNTVSFILNAQTGEMLAWYLLQN
ncbi:SAP domain-containing protein [Euryarchaeota archaeon]|nr:SAP domain-containing protein [Euryarchaeota archaeon]